MALSTKIVNNLFVWGNNTIYSGTDLAALVINADKFVDGVQGGELVKADELNSGLRAGSLMAYSILNALALGPLGAQSADESWNASLTDLSGSWDDSLTTRTFNYNLYNTQLEDFYTNIRIVLNQYLKYARVFKAVQANVWTTSRNFSINDNDDSNPGPTSSVNGSENVIIRLPSTIKASLTGNASTADKWKTSRTIKIASSDESGPCSGVSVDGSGNVTLKLPSTIKAALSGNASTASKWYTGRNISIASSDGSGVGIAQSVDGSANVTLRLPSTITASLTGTASNASKINNKTFDLTFNSSTGVLDITYTS